MGLGVALAYKMFVLVRIVATLHSCKVVVENVRAQGESTLVSYFFVLFMDSHRVLILGSLILVVFSLSVALPHARLVGI